MALTAQQWELIALAAVLAVGAFVAAYFWHAPLKKRTGDGGHGGRGLQLGEESPATIDFGRPAPVAYPAPKVYKRTQRPPFHDPGFDVYGVDLDSAGVRTGATASEVTEGENLLRYNKLSQYSIATQNRAIQDGPYALRGQEAKRYKRY